jgi:hypothetical protein
MKFGRKPTIPTEVKLLAGNSPLLAYTNSEIGLIVATGSGIKNSEFEIGWPAFFQASFDPPILKFSYQTPAGNVSKSIALIPIQDPNEFPNLVRSKVTSNVIAQSRVVYEGELEVIFSARRKSPTELNFVVTADPGIDIKSENFQVWAKRELAEFKETFGFSNF